jgi:CBS domain-containing protein
MNATAKAKRAAGSVVLRAETAAELMTPNPISIRDVASIKEAVAMLIDKGFSAAPVIDRGGRPVGVLSRTDILIHDREKAEYLPSQPEYYDRAELTLKSGETLGAGFQVEKSDPSTVGDIMTPVVFSVAPDTPARQVIRDMVSLKVHRLFVVDTNGVLVGVISALDVMRYLG